MYISYFSYLHSKVAVTDALNHYAYPCPWLHQMSDFSIVVMIATFSSCMCLFNSKGVFLPW